MVRKLELFGISDNCTYIGMARGIGELYVNWRVLGYRRIIRKLEGLGISENCT